MRLSCDIGRYLEKMVSLSSSLDMGVWLDLIGGMVSVTEGYNCTSVTYLKCVPQSMYTQSFLTGHVVTNR